MNHREYYEALTNEVLSRRITPEFLERFANYREGKSFEDVLQFSQACGFEDIRCDELPSKLAEIVEIDTSLDLRRYKLAVYVGGIRLGFSPDFKPSN